MHSLPEQRRGVTVWSFHTSLHTTIILVVSHRMNTKEAVTSLAALAHPQRLAIFRLLVREGPSGLPAGEIAEAVGAAPTAASFHLKELDRAGLLHVDADRALRPLRRAFRRHAQAADLPDRGLLPAAGRSSAAPLSRSRMRSVPVREARNDAAVQRPVSVHAQFGPIDHRRMRDEPARQRPLQRLQRRQPAERPRASLCLAAAAISSTTTRRDLRSKSWEEFAAAGAPQLDFVFTVCDDAANETCPVWPGQPMSAHWGLPDPSAATGSESERRLAFADTHRMLYQRIGIFTNLPLSSLDQAVAADAASTTSAGPRPPAPEPTR